MREILARARGTLLDLPAYQADFDGRFWRIGGEGFWKLERMQSYQETGFPSWEALCRGEWEDALALLDTLRPGYEEYRARITAAGFGHHRVRVVEEPVTPYVQWELHLLHLKEQYWENVSVVRASQIAHLESLRTLPELVVLGAEAVYEIHYTADGAPDGATRYTEPGLVEQARAFVQELHAAGESLATYFPREIRRLDPPVVPPRRGSCHRRQVTDQAR